MLPKTHPRIAHRRDSAARLARELRAMWPDLKGQWSRRDWNNQVQCAIHNHLSRLALIERGLNNRGR